MVRAVCSSIDFSFRAAVVETTHDSFLLAIFSIHIRYDQKRGLCFCRQADSRKDRWYVAIEAVGVVDE